MGGNAGTPDSIVHSYHAMIEHWGVLSPRLLKTELLTLPSDFLGQDFSLPFSWESEYIRHSPSALSISGQRSVSQRNKVDCSLTCDPLALQAEQTDLRRLRSHIIKQCTTHCSAKGDLCTREDESQHWVIHMAIFNYAWHYKEGKVTFPLFFFNIKRNVRFFLKNKVDFFPNKSSLGLLNWLSGKNPLPMQGMQEIMGSVPG